MYNLQNFNEYGVAYPFDFSDKSIKEEELLVEYEKFQKKQTYILEKK